MINTILNNLQGTLGIGDILMLVACITLIYAIILEVKQDKKQAGKKYYRYINHANPKQAITFEIK